MVEPELFLCIKVRTIVYASWSFYDIKQGINKIFKIECKTWEQQETLSTFLQVVISISVSLYFLLVLENRVLENKGGQKSQSSQVTQWYRICLPVQETWVRSLSWEDPLEEEMAIHAIFLAWEISWTESLLGCSPQGHKESDTSEGLDIKSETSASSTFYILGPLLLSCC